MKKDEKETYLQAFKTVFQVLAPAAGTAFFGNPVIGAAAGTTLLQIMYGIQSSVKQKRVFTFFDKLEKSMIRLQDKYDAESLDKVEIWDLI